MAEALHALGHRGRIENLVLSRADTARRRLHAFTDVGTEVGVAIDRDARLANGSVLLLEDDRAIVVRLQEQPWLGLAPRDEAAALELGYFCGNMHWKVRFVGSFLHVAVEGEPRDILVRIDHLLRDGRVRVLESG